MTTTRARLRCLMDHAGQLGWWTLEQLRKWAHLDERKIPITPAEQARLDAVAALPCCVCRILGLGNTPAEIHHLRTRPDGQKYGASERASHLETIPLCAIHHRLGGFGVAIHAGERRWETNFFPELHLLWFTNRWLALVVANTNPIPIPTIREVTHA